MACRCILIKPMAEIDKTQLAEGLQGKYDHAAAAVDKGNLDYAILLLKDILKTEPGFVEGREMLRAAQKAKKGAGAGFFGKIVGAASSGPALAKGQMALRREDYKTALIQAEEVLTDDPESQLAHRLLADAANALEMPRTAMPSVEILVAATPENKEICQLLASALEQLGDFEKAEKALQDLVEKNPDDFKLQQIFKDFSARATIKRGSYERIGSGKASVNEVVRDQGEANRVAREQQVHKSADVLQDMIFEKEKEFQQNTANMRLATEIAKLNVQAKNFDRAMEYYDYVSTNSQTADSAIDRLITDCHLSKFDHELSLLDRNAEDYDGRRLALEKERKDFVLKDCRKRAAKFPTDLDVRFELGEACFEAELYDDAVLAFQKAQGNVLYKHRAQCYLGRVFAVREMYDLAERSLLAAIDERHGFNDLRKEVLYHLAAVYEKMGRNDDAFARYQEIYEHDVKYRDVAKKVDVYYTIRKATDETSMESTLQPAAPAATPVGGASAAAAPRQSVGNGRFVLLRQLGRGGMGVVWLARDTDLEEDVALKLLPEEMAADLVALNELKRETAKSRCLSHPNIVRTHDLVQMPNEQPFISMEFVDGKMLESMRLEQDNQVFAWGQIEKYFLQLCEALDYAHGQKIVHRDLKPANMMITGGGQLKLADFGIAASMVDSLSRSSMRNVISGTATYMSPQQLQGDVPRATDDIYALGASLYELLTSRPPFYTGDLTYQVINVQPHVMGDRLAEIEVENAIPPYVEELVMACLSKDNAGRPQNAKVIAEWIRSKGDSELLAAGDEAAAGA